VAYDESLARRMRTEIGSLPGLVEKKMFGGVGFLVQGNMACGVHGDDLIVRVGPARYEEALARPHTRPFDMTRRPISGWVMVASEGIARYDDLRAWVQQGVEYALSLPAKGF
jgi:TfoX/Sxy family transcriptional regulator of competence genes